MSNLIRQPQLPVVKWIKKRKALGQDYQITVLESCTEADDLIEAEMFHIAYFRSLGVSLLNCSDGGEGLTNPSPEVRAKLSAAQKAIKGTPESRARQSRLTKGMKRSPETCAKISVAVRSRPPITEETRKKQCLAQSNPSQEKRARMAAGQKRRPPITEGTRQVLREAFARRSPESIALMRERSKSPQARAKNSAANLGRTHVCSDETKAKLSVIARNRSDETKEKMVAPRRGRPLSEEHKENISAAQRGKPKPFSAEHLANVIAANKARAGKPNPLSAERLEKLIAMNKARAKKV